MSPTRRIATFVGGRRTKWLVVVFWVIIFAVASPLASKFNGVQENEAVNWLPGSAESTKVVKESEAFQPGDTIPTVIVYQRPSGITDADTAKVTDDISRYRGGDRAIRRDRPGLRMARPLRSLSPLTSARTAGRTSPASSTTCAPSRRRMPTG